jgi:cytoskeletal protein CcmA (bactofilin family)/DNA-directed RNA polymerase subunit RPC12/RpoP
VKPRSGDQPKAAAKPRSVAASKQKTISATCPKCGHVQDEPRGSYSTICKKCRSHFRLEDEAPKTSKVPKAPKPTIELRKISCFQCGTELEVPTAAESTMCKRCSSHVDLRDYLITQTISKNFRTYGRLVVEEKGYVLNTDSLVGEAVLKGRLIGKLVAHRSLEIYSTAAIKGSFNTGKLIIPVGNSFRWPELLRIGGAEIGGELVANIQSSGSIVLKSTARLFGDVQAANLVVESGAVFVGNAKIGRPPSEETPAKAATTISPTKPARKTVRSAD